MDDPQLIIGAILFPLLIAYLIYVKNKYIKNDSSYLLLAYLLGCIITIPVLIAQLSVDFIVINDFIKYFFQAALIEEGFKFLILYGFKKFISDNFDSLKYAILISLGFAMVENIGFAFKGIEQGNGGFETVVLRMFTAIPAHLIFGLNMGYFWGLFIQKTRYKYLFLVLSLACPILIHGLYDYFNLPTSIGILIFTIIINYFPIKFFLTNK